MDAKAKPDRCVPRFPAPAAPRPRARLRAPDPKCRLTVSRKLLVETLERLRDRSAGWRESGAIWAGTVRDELEWSASEVFLHHDLCDDVGAPLSLSLTEDAKLGLYQSLRARALRIVALIHTHPFDWVGLSEIDQRNQVSSRVGFWSIVIPHYGRQPWDLEQMGFHVRAVRGWHQLSRDAVRKRVVITE